MEEGNMPGNSGTAPVDIFDYGGVLAYPPVKLEVDYLFAFTDVTAWPVSRVCFWTLLSLSNILAGNVEWLNFSLAIPFILLLLSFWVDATLLSWLFTSLWVYEPSSTNTPYTFFRTFASPACLVMMWCCKAFKRRNVLLQLPHRNWGTLDELPLPVLLLPLLILLCATKLECIMIEPSQRLTQMIVGDALFTKWCLEITFSSWPYIKLSP